jgi:hypothetical protein
VDSRRTQGNKQQADVDRGDTQSENPSFLASVHSVVSDSPVLS